MNSTVSFLSIKGLKELNPNKYREYNDKTILIQKYFRGYIARRNVQTKICAILTI